MSLPPLDPYALSMRPEELRQKAEDAVAETAETPATPADRTLHEFECALHELQVHRIELELQNEELQLAQRRLEAERTRYYDLYDLAPVGYATVRKSNQIEECNLALANLLGLSPAELVEQPLLQFIHPSDRADYTRHHALACSSGEAQVSELRVVDKGRKAIWIRIESAPLEGSSGTYRCIVSDIAAMRSLMAERAGLERDLAQSKRLAANGTMADGIAAEIRKPIASIDESVLSAEAMILELKPILGTARELSEAIGSDINGPGLGISRLANELSSMLEQPQHNGLIDRVVETISDARRGCRSVESAVQSMGVFSNSSIHPDDRIIGKSQAILDCQALVARAARTEVGVFLTGETGTGKELFARAVHESSRCTGPLIAVNCAALPESLMESELFGHTKGAYTGATSQQPGKFQLAESGTLFLDEIGELSLDVQSKLLRILQGSQYFQVGGTKPLVFNGRVVAATNADLERAVSRGTFRADLFYRITTFPITIPPLRDRGEDVHELLSHFVEKYGRPLGREISSVSEELSKLVGSHRWPGNVRELESFVQRALICGDGPVLEFTGSLQQPLRHAAPTAHCETLEAALRTCIMKALTATGWVVEGEHGAAERLGLKSSTLRSKMARLAIARGDD